MGEPDESGRPTKPLPKRQLLAISVYWLGINAIWGGLNIQALPPLSEMFLGPLYGPAGFGVMVAAGVILAIATTPCRLC